MLVVTALTLALIGFVACTLTNLARHDGQKIVAALQGRSWTAELHRPSRPVTIRFSSRYTAAKPERSQPALRAAA